MMFDSSSIFVRIGRKLICTYIRSFNLGSIPMGSKPGTIARLICDVYKPDELHLQGDPRSNLKRVLRNEMKKKTAQASTWGPEPEFFLFKNG